MTVLTERLVQDEESPGTPIKHAVSTPSIRYNPQTPLGQGRSTSSSNLIAKGREYLTQQIMPTFETSDSEEPELFKMPSWGKIQGNTILHNSESPCAEKFESPRSICRRLEPGGQRTCVLTLVATALGSGVLALPFAFSHTGLVLGIVLLLVAACASCLSLAVLMMASRYTEAQSYGELIALATGSAAVGSWLDAIQVCYGFSVILALQIFEGDFVPAIYEGFGMVRPSRTSAILGVAALVAPLMLPTKVSALRYAAALTPLAIFYIAGNVAVQAPAHYNARPKDSELQIYVSDPVQLMQSMCIFVFSVMCHANAVPVVHLLERPSVARIVKVATYTNTCLVALYLFIGVGGYMSFQASVQGDFLLNYPVRSVGILCCRIMMALVCFVGIPLNSGFGVEAMLKLGTGKRPEEHPVIFAALALMLLHVTTLAAVNCQDAALVLSLIGGSLTTIQMFWLPGFVYWKMLYPTQPKGFRVMVMIAMISGGMVGFSSVVATIARMF